MSSSDVEDQNEFSTFTISKPNDNKSDSFNEDLPPSTPPRSKLNRRFTHDTIDSDDIKLDNVDPSLLNDDENDAEKPNYNTYQIPKVKKANKVPALNTNITKSNLINKVSASGDSSPKPLKTMTSCSIEAEKEMESLLRSENVDLRKQLEKNNQCLEDMRKCVIEYESTIRDLNDANEKKISEKISVINNLICERDQAVQDLNTIEKAFSDLQRRFEKSKEIIDNLHKNESVLKKHTDDLKEELNKSETKYQNLKVMTERRLKKSTDEVTAAKRENESEITRLQAIAKKGELKINSLEKQLSHKIEENVELNKICEELISKYSSEA